MKTYKRKLQVTPDTVKTATELWPYLMTKKELRDHGIDLRKAVWVFPKGVKELMVHPINFVSIGVPYVFTAPVIAPPLNIIS